MNHYNEPYSYLSLPSTITTRYHYTMQPDMSFCHDGFLGFHQNQSGSDAASSSMVAEVEEEVTCAIRAKIASHPLYPKLLKAYIDCQRVGASPEINQALNEADLENDLVSTNPVSSFCLDADPELDNFMDSYCEVLLKYKSDLSRPFDEATTFINIVQTQLSNLCNGDLTTSLTGCSEGEKDTQDYCQTNDDSELKQELLRKYSGYINNLKQDFSKKKRNGKLPKEAKQMLLQWWSNHSKWPYPTDADKVLLAEATGLEQKQINNWFINQRKRHWKPSDDMHFPVMDGLYGPFFC